MRQMTTYRRTYPARRVYQRQGQGGGGKGSAGRVLLGLLAMAAILYFVMASAAGNWISENIVNPVMEAFNPVTPQAEVAKSPEPLPAAMQNGAQDQLQAAQGEPAAEADADIGAPSAAGTGIEFKLNGAASYAVQTGAFKSEENAKKEADVVRTRGGAGYVYFDGELYRVLASAYATEAEASTVREQLKEELIDSGTFKLDIKEVALRVTAGESVVSALNGAVSALEKARSDMFALCIAYDKEEVTASKAAESITSMKNEIGGALDKLKTEAGTDNSVIKRLEECCEKIMEDLAGLASDAKGSALDFSSRMKYTQIGIIDATAQFVDAITKSA